MLLIGGGPLDPAFHPLLTGLHRGKGQRAARRERGRDLAAEGELVVLVPGQLANVTEAVAAERGIVVRPGLRRVAGFSIVTFGVVLGSVGSVMGLPFSS